MKRVVARPEEPAIAVHPHRDPHSWQARYRVEEFSRLVEAAECRIVAQFVFPMRRVRAGTYLGPGQVREVAEAVAAHQATVVFVDAMLSPVQQRNLERAWNAKVVDFTGLVLEIFAHRARTKEGALQVELASLTYQLGRLVRSWTHLERQRGGYGFLGGPGERQIELDRRLIRNRIKQIKKEIERVRRMRAVQRTGRKRRGVLTIAMVGYTNAGKSTLFNRLVGAHVEAADKLFATLDPTIRTLELGGGRKVVLSDTVGFIQNLPHELVDAFHATLEAVAEADLILHVRDIAAPNTDAQARVVYETLEKIGVAGPKRPPIVEIWNKKDLKPEVQSRILERVDGSRVALSAKTGEGIEELLALLRRWYDAQSLRKRICVAASDGKTRAFLYAHGEVHEESIHPDGAIELDVTMPAALWGRIDEEGGRARLRES